MKQYWIRAAEYAGLEPGATQIDTMERYGVWLATEGLAAGGIGPSEPARIDRRHLADSLLFASQLDQGVERVWDLGSGAGLPGVPLAICLPRVEFVLIDRSGRRVDLLNRVVRVLGLSNCLVEQRDIYDLDGPMEVIVTRASLPTGDFGAVAEGLLAPGGVAITAGSWHSKPMESGWSTVEIPRDVLDQTVWLLMMRR